MKKMNLKKGFTLIELLVVVAIIGALASVILAALNSTRAKGADANIKANLANIRPQAELIYSGSGCYGDATPITDTTCAAFAEATCTFATADTLFANGVVAAQIVSATNAASGAANGVCSSEANGTAWAVAVSLKNTAGSAWCVDSTGMAKAFVGTPTAAITTSRCN